MPEEAVPPPDEEMRAAGGGGQTPAAQSASVPPTWDMAQLSAAFASAAFERRGFVNGGNLCFANATLQTLLGLDAFVALLRHLAQQAQLPATCPTLRSLVALAREFPATERTPETRAPPRSNKSLHLDDFFSSFLAKFDASVSAGAPTSARGARQAARHLRPQQDAHEFMSALLDAAHTARCCLHCRGDH